MASVNKCIFIGNLGKDPEIRYLPSGEAVANFSIACSETWTDKLGAKQEQTEWVRISAFGKTAEIAGEYLKKGSQVYIEGRMQTRKWTDKENQERYTTEIRCDRMQMLGGKRQNDSADKEATAKDYARESGAGEKRAAAIAKLGSLEEDIPF